MTNDDVLELYEIKCKKYKPEQLTDRLKNVLFHEARKEVQFMNFVNGRS